MKKLALFALAILATSCTYTITQVHTEGQATDVVDDTSAPTATVTPTVNLPKTL